MKNISEPFIDLLADCTIGIKSYEEAELQIPQYILKDEYLARQFIENALESDEKRLINAAIAWHFLYDNHGSMVDLLGRLLLSEKHEQHEEILMYSSCPEFAELTPYLDQLLSTEFKGHLEHAPYPKWVYWTLYRINIPESNAVLKKHDMWQEE